MTELRDKPQLHLVEPSSAIHKSIPRPKIRPLFVPESSRLQIIPIEEYRHKKLDLRDWDEVPNPLDSDPFLLSKFAPE